MITIHQKAVTKMRQELSFELFKHNGLLCCVQRMGCGGNLNGYVAVTKEHALFGKSYSDIDMALIAHGGITFSRAELPGIDKELFGELWWFGFDTAHAGDLRPFQTDIDRKYPLRNEEYRDFEYVKEQTMHLAEQLTQLWRIW